MNKKAIKERRRLKAVKRSQLATKTKKKNYNSTHELRLENYNKENKRKEILFRKFN